MSDLVQKPRPHLITLRERLVLKLELHGVLQRLDVVSQNAASSDTLEIKTLESRREYLRRWLDLGVEPQFAKPHDPHQPIFIH